MRRGQGSWPTDESKPLPLVRLRQSLMHAMLLIADFLFSDRPLQLIKLPQKYCRFQVDRKYKVLQNC